MVLQGVSLYGANLEWVELRDADLTGAQLEDADLRHADLSGANLERARFDYARMEGCVLLRARLDGASFIRTLMDRKTVEASQWTPEEICSLRDRGALFIDVDQFPAHLQKTLALHALKDFLKLSFNGRELKRWMQAHPNTRPVASAVFWRQSLDAVVDEVCETLQRHGLITPDLFRRLNDERPQRTDEIDILARQWRFSLEEAGAARD
ncbi:MAG: pentapeptide repeat-containing protein [Myxococcota bacterium]